MLHPEVRYYNLMRLIYVRLTRFAKTEEECRSDLDRMLFIFKNAHTLGKVPKSFKKMVFKRLFEISRISNFTEEELMDYESDMKRFSDHANALAWAEEKGINKGEARGEARGVMKIARNMLAKGYSVAEVIGITNLSRGQVRALNKA